MFEESTVAELKERIDSLTLGSRPIWGKMSVGQMLAHCNISYEFVFEADKHPKPNALVKFLLKSFVKPAVVNDKPFRHNGRTAPFFLVTDERDFSKEKETLKAYIGKVRQLGPAYFDGKESHSFGTLTKEEWSNLFFKHLDHHLRQFGA